MQVCFLGSMRWRGFDTWPPPSSASHTLWLSHTGELDVSPPCWRRDGQPCVRSLQYAYRPADPTPAAGGPSFNPLNAGGCSQSAIERRNDVLLFTSAELSEPLCLGGSGTLQVRVWASARSVDIVARVCRVDKRGRSTNVCEGLTRVNAEEGEASIGSGGSAAAGGANGGATSGAGAGSDIGSGRLVSVELAPLAVDIAAGERLRLHVCSAAHPRWMRNLCADPSVPLHEQMPPKGEEAECIVRVGVNDEGCRLVLPIVAKGC